MYGCRTWFLTLREEHSLRMFENRVLMTKGGEVGDWRKLCSEVRQHLYSSVNINTVIKSEKMQCSGHVSH
jgi:hypothetical protein